MNARYEYFCICALACLGSLCLLLVNYVRQRWDTKMLYISQFTRVKKQHFFDFRGGDRSFFPALLFLLNYFHRKTTFQVPFTRKCPNYAEKLCKTHSFYAQNYNIWLSQAFSPPGHSRNAARAQAERRRGTGRARTYAEQEHTQNRSARRTWAQANPEPYANPEHIQRKPGNNIPGLLHVGSRTAVVYTIFPYRLSDPAHCSRPLQDTDPAGARCSRHSAGCRLR